MKKIRSNLFVFVLTVMATHYVDAQVIHAKSLQPDSTTYKNVFVKKLYSDSLSSTFAIWVRNEVKPHKHKVHTEVVSVIKGKALMTVAGKTQIIRKGDIILIPEGAVHSVITTSKKPLLVISVQSPQFSGKDRYWVK
ncbi:MAG: mannose-6-phosphate isomerase-like protein (cupin superfamily) [Bacteroidia bacterium]